MPGHCRALGGNKLAPRLYRVAVIECGHMDEEHVKRLYDQEYIELADTRELDTAIR